MTVTLKAGDVVKVKGAWKESFVHGVEYPYSTFSGRLVTRHPRPVRRTSERSSWTFDPQSRYAFFCVKSFYFFLKLRLMLGLGLVLGLVLGLG